jgi:PTS system nitrogen regulatory IIA component
MTMGLPGAVPSSQDDILTIRQLSEYLMVSEKTIYRLLEKNILPAIRVGGQWRFRRRDIDSWIDSQVKKVEIDGDRHVAAEFEQSKIEFAPLIEEDNIWLDVPPMSRDELFTWMILKAKLDDGINRDALTEAVLQRERICSTALLDHAAFPHTDDPSKFRFSRKRVLLAILPEPVHYFDPHGHQPSVIAMILARTVRGYLLTISRAIKLFGASDLIDRLKNCKQGADAIRLIRDAEEMLLIPGRS